MATGRLRPIAVKSTWTLRWLDPRTNPAAYVATVIVLLLFEATKDLYAFGFTGRFAIAMGTGCLVYFVSVVVQELIESNERIRSILERFQEQGPAKKSFSKAPLPKTWDDYFVLQIKLSKLDLLSYPRGRDAELTPREASAYAVFTFLTHSPLPILGRRKPDPESYFVNRVSRSDVYSPKNQFSSHEIKEFGKRHGREIDDNEAVWIVGMAKNPETVTIHFDDTVQYFSCFALCNDVWFQERKFPREPDYPFFVTQRHLADFKRGDFRALKGNPAILGIEVIVVTKDKRIILQERSSRTAIHRNTFIPSVSAGYEKADFDGGPLYGETNPLLKGLARETVRELGLKWNSSQIERVAVLGLMHIATTNELNVVALIETALTSEQFVDQLRGLIKTIGSRKGEKERASEHFEYLRILLPKVEEVREFAGDWRKYFEDHGHRLERCVCALHFFCLAEDHRDGIPWRPVSRVEDGEEVAEEAGSSPGLAPGSE
jgi:hypothetical protein